MVPLSGSRDRDRDRDYLRYAVDAGAAATADVLDRLGISHAYGSRCRQRLISAGTAYLAWSVRSAL